MTGICITARAAARYVERLAPHMTIIEARAAIAKHEKAVSVAARFGCTCVKLGNNARLILDAEGAVVTVLSPEQYRTANRGRCL